MVATLLRGRVLDFTGEPGLDDDTSAWSYFEDGAVLVEDGKIVARGDHASVAKLAPADAEYADHRPHLLLAGLIDTHIHFPQMQVIGSYGTQLLDWLNKYTFVEEQKFASEAHSKRIAGHFVDELIRHGTTTAVAYCSVHRVSAEAYFEEAARRNMCLIGGKVMMDRNAPEALRDTPKSSYDDTKALIAKWHRNGRARYAISPRFGITSSDEQMKTAQALAAEHPDCFVQTHLSENHNEIAFTKELFPWARDYTDVYEKFGLLGPKSLFGHCIHLEPREMSVLAESQSVTVFCPTSNLFLGSGLFDRQKLRENGVRIAVATDVGGGTNYSMLATLDEAYKILQMRGQKLSPMNAFYIMTLGNARALGMDNEIGTLAPGSAADIVVLDSSATPAMKLRSETVKTLQEELFVLQTMGDDRSVAEVYVAGTAQKRGIR